jgi:hypothetical protein
LLTWATELQRRSRTKKRQSGGAIKQFAFSAQAVASLAAIRARDGDATDVACIERLLREATPME